jgi:uncharacterized protein (DUF2141 family)
MNKGSFYLYFTILFVVLCISCARIGAPSGGIKDEISPKILLMKPSDISINISKELKKITIQFDEYIELKNPSDQIIISPPLDDLPQFKPENKPKKSVTIEFKKPLSENTTYTINFGNSIVDYNEGNILPHLNYVFSTGDKIDSLSLSGKIFDPNSTNEKEESTVLVGLYKYDNQYNDSIILKSKPQYLTKLGKEKGFTFKHLKEGEYKLIAFEDKNKNILFDPESEKIGFIQDFVNPKDKKEFNITLFKPKPKYKFKEVKSNLYGELKFLFEGLSPKVKIESIDKKILTETIFVEKDSVFYWFDPEKEMIEKDFAFNFIITNEEKNTIDTVSCNYQKINKKDLEIHFEKTLLTPENSIQFESKTPLTLIDKQKIFIYKIQNKDTIAIPFQVKLENKKHVVLDFIPEINKEYLVNLLPKAIVDFYGNTNKEVISKKIFTPRPQDFGSVQIAVENAPKSPFILYLYDEKNRLIKSISSDQKDFKFNYLTPGKYSVKILIDDNKNQQWDTGDFFKGIQPERILILEKIIEARALWNVNEIWKNKD